MTRFTLLCAMIALPLCLAGCAAGSSDYPSLAKRDAERVSGTADPVDAIAPETTEPPGSPSAALEDRLAGLVARARRAHDDFLSRRGRAEQAINESRGSASTSDGWTNAQVVLSSLQAARSDAVIALADLDLLYAEERLAFPEPPSPAALAIADARKQVQDLVTEQDATLARLADLSD